MQFGKKISFDKNKRKKRKNMNIQEGNKKKRDFVMVRASLILTHIYTKT